MFGSPFQPVPQPRLEPIDRFARGDALDLSTDEPAIDVEIGLRDHGSLHRRIGMPGQLDAGVQHRSVGEPAEPPILLRAYSAAPGSRPCVVTSTSRTDGKLGSVPHGLVVTPPANAGTRAKGHRTVENGPRLALRASKSTVYRRSAAWKTCI